MWGIAVGAAFVLGMFVSSGPVYGPHFNTWDGLNFHSYLSTVDNKLGSASKFFAPPGGDPPENAGDAEITLKLISADLDALESTFNAWTEFCGTRACENLQRTVDGDSNTCEACQFEYQKALDACDTKECVLEAQENFSRCVSSLPEDEQRLCRVR